MVAPGGGDLQRGARGPLSGDLGQIGPPRPGPGSAATPAPMPAPGMVSPASIGSGLPASSGSSSSGTGSSVRTAISWRRLRTPSTETPGTRDASAAVCSGTTTCRYPASAAASTAGSTPRTGRTRPSRPSSPIIIRSAISRGSMRSAAPSTAQATARSKPLPPLGTDAGLSPTVSFFCGQVAPELTTAARTRSRLSTRDLSGRPTRVKAATPGSRSAWTSTTTPSTPTSATEQVRANPIQATPRRCSTTGAPRRGSTTPTRSIRTPPGGGPPCRSSQRSASRRSRAVLPGLTAAVGGS